MQPLRRCVNCAAPRLTSAADLVQCYRIMRYTLCCGRPGCIRLRYKIPAGGAALAQRCLARSACREATVTLRKLLEDSWKCHRKTVHFVGSCMPRELCKRHFVHIQTPHACIQKQPDHLQDDTSGETVQDTGPRIFLE